MPEKKITFRKAERLCNKRIITELFNYNESQVISEYPFLLKWIVKNELRTSFAAQVVISVSRRFSKKAVARNRVKRQIRELYRLNKHYIYEVLEPLNLKVALLLIFIGKESVKSDFLKTKFEILVERFIKNIKQTG